MSKSNGKVIFVSASGGVIVVQSSIGFTVAELRCQGGEFPRSAEVSANWQASGAAPLMLGRRRFQANFRGTHACIEEAVQTARAIGGG